MKYWIQSLRYKLVMTLILGLIYPILITAIAAILFPSQQKGDFLSRGGQIIGAKNIAQNFEKTFYFWPRPSAVGYNPLPSGGSNLGQQNADLKKTFEERKMKLKAAHPEQSKEPPQDLLFASASGLDPHISPEAAEYQMERVAKSRNMDIEQVKKLIRENTEGRQLGILGEPTVNVLALNLSLDKVQGIDSAPVIVPPPAQPTK